MKLKQKIIEKYHDVIGNAAEGLTDIIIKRDDFNQAIRDIDKINGYFEFFYSKIIYMFKYLRDEFGVMVDYEGDDITEQIEGIEKHYKKFRNTTINKKWLNKVNIRKYKKAINKWLAINNAMEVLPELIRYWKEKTDNLEIYKEIDIDKIEEKLSEASIYQKSFDYYKQNSDKIELKR